MRGTILIHIQPTGYALDYAITGDRDGLLDFSRPLARDNHFAFRQWAFTSPHLAKTAFKKIVSCN